MKETIKNFAKQFRDWQRQWDLFDKKQILKKPKSIDVFIEDLLLQYNKEKQLPIESTVKIKTHLIQTGQKAEEQDIINFALKFTFDNLR